MTYAISQFRTRLTDKMSVKSMYLCGDIVICFFLQIVRAYRGALLAYRLPAIICYLIIIGSYTFDLGMKIYLYCKSDHSSRVRNLNLFE